ncbi:hypothetical protein G5714_010895 [Onychostoma macrolepis]|uniref:Uncharacterized protein n=1 Tax=Onychostoma macrolepis TaxID=369639 RepID=A0A7J6CLT9_9TELE|nr:hypothetical protein G5714_010895 [Onychostoma macrolepis]
MRLPEYCRPHSALSGLSTCPHCDSLQLKVLHSRVEVFSEVAPPLPTPAEAPHKALAWGDTCDPDREDGAALEFSPFRSLSTTRVQEVGGNFVEPVVFADEDLRPTPKAYNTISFSCGLPREIERRQPPAARSHSSSSHCQRSAPREEPSPMAPPHKDWGPRAYPPARQRQRKRLDLSSTAKTSRHSGP